MLHMHKDGPLCSHGRDSLFHQRRGWSLPHLSPVPIFFRYGFLYLEARSLG